MGPSQSWTLRSPSHLQVGLTERITLDLKLCPECCLRLSTLKESKCPSMIDTLYSMGKIINPGMTGYIGPLYQDRNCQYICTCVDTYSEYLVANAYNHATQQNTIKNEKSLHWIMVPQPKHIQTMALTSKVSLLVSMQKNMVFNGSITYPITLKLQDW